MTLSNPPEPSASPEIPMLIGSDHAGFALKTHLLAHLKSRGIVTQDVGCFSEASVDYPQIGAQLAEQLELNARKNEFKNPPRGILVCGSGIGISISANRFPWVRAVLAHDHHTAIMSRRHNDANVICFGGRVIAPELACDILDVWLATPFDGGRHQHRVDRMNDLKPHFNQQSQQSLKEFSEC